MKYAIILAILISSCATQKKATDLSGGIVICQTIYYPIDSVGRAAIDSGMCGFAVINLYSKVICDTIYPSKGVQYKH